MGGIWALSSGVLYYYRFGGLFRGGGGKGGGALCLSFELVLFCVLSHALTPCVSYILNIPKLFQFRH